MIMTTTEGARQKNTFKIVTPLSVNNGSPVRIMKKSPIMDEVEVEKIKSSKNVAIIID